nr:M48 family metalloprotease [uncultured Caldimonas sp.]
MHDHSNDFAARLRGNRLTRRDTLWLFGASTAAVAGLQGCATSPVTGQSIVVGLSEDQEKRIDAQQAPHQFSQDLGAVQDAKLNEYVAGIGRDLHENSHRKQMPYSYRVLNANYVNAYTFPAGAVGVTRGIMTELDDESQLAALLGHELGHVNARHAAQRQGQALIAQAVVVGIGVATMDSRWGALAGLGSQIGASALLSSYSRDNEREADALGQEYMVRSGYPATGMTELHQMLVDQQKEQPSVLATMFSSHPMSAERRDTAKQLAETKYASSLKAPVRRERYMDHTAGLRRIKPTIDACKNGETAMSRKSYKDAQEQFTSAVKHTPQDYAANLRMAQCLQAQGNTKEAQRYAQAAKTIYPQEAQARKLSGVLALSAKEPAKAYEELDAFDRLLPGDPGVTFLKGVSLEGMGDRARAAQHYNAYLRLTQEGDAAKYSASRLKAWGYAK